ncbi:unnamed protein product [Pedinophyceae sp. YPF-701]|nr:unnamed protein product [Pedinophyceae sp. YPF-701]
MGSRDRRSRSRERSRRRDRSRDRSRERDRRRSPRRDRERRRDGDSRRKRSRSASSDSGSDGERARRKAEKLTRYLEKRSGGAEAERFVWGKKIERDVAAGADVRQFSTRAEDERRVQRIQELQEVRRQIKERELERERMREDMAELERMKNQEETEGDLAREQEFHLRTARQRSAIRLNEGRPKPIDRCMLCLYAGHEDMGVARPPEAAPAVLAPLTHKEVEELAAEVEEMRALDSHTEAGREYWGALSQLCAWELGEKARSEAIERAQVRGEPLEGLALTPLQEAMEAEIATLFVDKDRAALDELEGEVRGMIESGAAEDPEYWDMVLKRLVVHRARAVLRGVHATTLERVVAIEAARDAAGGAEGAAVGADDLVADLGLPAQNDEEIDLPDVSDDEDAGAAPSSRGGEEGADEGAAAGGEEGGDADAEGEAAAAPRELEAEDRAALERDDDDAGAAVAGGPAGDEFARPRGRWSPEPVDFALLPEAEREAAVTLAHEMREVEYMRAQVKYRAALRFKAAAAMAVMQGSGDPNAAARKGRGVAGVRHGMLKNLTDQAEQEGAYAYRTGGVDETDERHAEQLKKLAAKMMGPSEGEAGFSTEVDLDAQVYWWHDKYKPRRPKYFNRVHTGYAWTKYNRAHYDRDNPPPKSVTGYKFNVFYPDLIDKTKAPSFKIERDPESPDGSTCILRFVAGPPYEDVAFRIVNQEWEYSHKKGFKCVFDRGILHLFFNFVRQSYRR